MENFSESFGITQNGFDILSRLIPDSWEYAGDIGKKSTGILDLYMLAFTLAQKNLKKQGEI